MFFHSLAVKIPRVKMKLVKVNRWSDVTPHCGKSCYVTR